MNKEEFHRRMPIIEVISETLSKEEKIKVLQLSAEQISLAVALYKEHVLETLKLIDKTIGITKSIPISISADDSILENIVRDNIEEVEQIIKRVKRERSPSRAKGFAIR